MYNKSKAYNDTLANIRNGRHVVYLRTISLLALGSL